MIALAFPVYLLWKGRLPTYLGLAGSSAGVPTVTLGSAGAP